MKDNPLPPLLLYTSTPPPHKINNVCKRSGKPEAQKLITRQVFECFKIRKEKEDKK